LDRAAWSFRVLGFRVNVQVTFLIILGIFVLRGLQYQSPAVVLISWPIVVFLSIVWHELGHALTARYLKVWSGDIELHWIGGHVPVGSTDPRRRLMIDLAGPAFGLVVGFLAVGVTQALGFDAWQLMFGPSWGLPPHLVVLGDVLYVNLLWSFVNLLPLRPLDGGNALFSFLSMNLGNTRQAHRVTAAAGVVTGLTAAILLASSGRMFLALAAAYLTYLNVQAWQQTR